MKFVSMSDKAILSEIGERIRRERLNQNISQIHLAEHAGISRKVVQSLEAGTGCSLEGMIKILRAFGKLDQLDVLLPDPGISPIQLARLAGQQRMRASRSRGKGKREVAS